MEEENFNPNCIITVTMQCPWRLRFMSWNTMEPPSIPGTTKLVYTGQLLMYLEE